MSLRGYTSRPPVPEEREVNRLHAEAVKKQKDAAEAAAARKRKRKEKHDKACKITHAEGKPRPAVAAPFKLNRLKCTNHHLNT